MLFGLVYSTTVASFPKGIFVLAACILAISLLLLARIRPPFAAEMKKKAKVNAGGGSALVAAHRKRRGNARAGGGAWAFVYPGDDAEEEAGAERGRSRVSKDLSRNTAGVTSTSTTTINTNTNTATAPTATMEAVAGGGGDDDENGNRNCGVPRDDQAYGDV